MFMQASAASGGNKLEELSRGRIVELKFRLFKQLTFFFDNSQ